MPTCLHPPHLILEIHQTADTDLKARSFQSILLSDSKPASLPFGPQTALEQPRTASQRPMGRCGGAGKEMPVSHVLYPVSQPLTTSSLSIPQHAMPAPPLTARGVTRWKPHSTGRQNPPRGIPKHSCLSKNKKSEASFLRALSPRVDVKCRLYFHKCSARNLWSSSENLDLI